MQMIIYLYDDKVLILKCSLFLSNTNKLKCSLPRYMKVFGYASVWYKNF